MQTALRVEQRHFDHTYDGSNAQFGMLNTSVKATQHDMYMQGLFQGRLKTWLGLLQLDACHGWQPQKWALKNGSNPTNPDKPQVNVYCICCFCKCKGNVSSELCQPWHF